MDLHKNAGSCPKSRAVLVRRVVEEGWAVKEGAEAQGLSTRAAYRWLARYRVQGLAGLEDRSCRPHHVPRRTSRERIEAMLRLREEGLLGDKLRDETLWASIKEQVSAGELVDITPYDRAMKFQRP